MKKLSAEEFSQLSVKGKGRSSAVFNSLINLQEGEGLLIEQKDWTRKAAPSSLVRYIEKKYQMKFSFGALENGSGWAVQRLNEIKKEIKKTEKAQIDQPKMNTERLEMKSEIFLSCNSVHSLKSFCAVLKMFSKLAISNSVSLKPSSLPFSINLN